jgi:PAS domain S-box-containing protein
LRFILKEKDAVTTRLAKRIEALESEIEALKRDALEGRKFKRIYDESAAAIFLLDSEMRFIDANRAGLDMFGCSRDELVAMTVKDVGITDEQAAYVKEQLETGRLVNYEHEVRRKDGGVIIALNNSSAIIDDDGKMAGILSALIDITEKKRIERENLELEQKLLRAEKLQAETALCKSESLVSAINDNLYNGMIYQVLRRPDGSRRFTYLSERVIDFYGVTPEQGMADPMLIYGRVHPEDAERVYSGEEQANVDMSVFQAETRVLFPDGSVRWSQFVSRPTALDDGSTRWDGIEFDVTQRKNAEIALAEYQRDLERIIEERTAELKKTGEQLLQSQKMEAIGLLAGGIAHDFNNILATIGGTAELMLRATPSDSSMAQKADRILNSCRRARDLTMKLLTFARREKLNVKAVSPNEIAEDMLEMMKSAASPSIAMSARLSEDVGMISADANQIYQALLNICLNACDAMRLGGELILRTERVEIDATAAALKDVRPGRFAVISIRDTGEGIDPECLGSIFEPFFTTKDRGKGSGLGLSISHGIIKAHGGCIDVSTEKGKGSVFSVYLPAEEGGEEPERETTALRTGRHFNGRLLIIDDDVDFAQTLKESLEVEGFEAAAAISGPEGIDYYRDNRDSTDLVILDMLLPGMPGVEIFRELREINPEAKVVLCSGYSIEGDATELLRRGALAFIQKPFEISEITEVLSKLLQGK